MEKKECKLCGAIYPAEHEECPECGHVNKDIEIGLIDYLMEIKNDVEQLPKYKGRNYHHRLKEIEAKKKAVCSLVEYCN